VGAVSVAVAGTCPLHATETQPIRRANGPSGVAITETETTGAVEAVDTVRAAGLRPVARGGIREASAGSRAVDTSGADTVVEARHARTARALPVTPCTIVTRYTLIAGSACPETVHTIGITETDDLRILTGPVSTALDTVRLWALLLALRPVPVIGTGITGCSVPVPCRRGAVAAAVAIGLADTTTVANIIRASGA